MKSNFKLIKTIPTLDATGHIYKDKKRDCFVFIDKNGVMDIEEEKDILIIKKYERALDKKNQKQKIIKIKTNIGIALLLALTSVVKYKTNEYFKESNKEKIEYLQSNRGVEDNLLLLHRSMDKNKTLSLALQEELKQYIEIFAQYDSGMSIVHVASRIKYMDFSQAETINLQVLKKIFNFNNGEFIVKELYCTVNDLYGGRNSYENLIVNYLFFNKEELENVLCGKDLRLEIDGKKYLVCLENLRYYQQEVFDYLKNYQEEKLKECNSNKNLVIQTTIFSPMLRVFEFPYAPFYYKKENDTLVDYTDEVYIHKLNDFIALNGTNFDYYNKDSRILLYMYIDALKNPNSILHNQDMASFIYYRIKEQNYPFVAHNYVFSYIDLLNFFELGVIHYDRLEEGWDFVFDSEKIDLLQELNLCMKIEVTEGNIKKSDYDDFIVKVRQVLSNYPEIYEQFQEANVLNDSVDGFHLGLVFEPKNSMN